MLLSVLLHTGEPGIIEWIVVVLMLVAALLALTLALRLPRQARFQHKSEEREQISETRQG